MTLSPLGRTALAIAIVLAALPSAVRAHPVKDPVCRMSVDSDTTFFRIDTDGGRSWYFCSTACRDRFVANEKAYIARANALALSQPKYRASLTATAAPGHPLTRTLTITITDAATGRVVRNFETVHQKLLHLVLTSDNLKWFEHQHPVIQSDGSFRITWTFPRRGRYTLFADFTPSSGDNQIKAMPLEIGREQPAEESYSLAPDDTAAKIVGDMVVRLKVRRPDKLCADTILTYSFATVDGKPVTDMQPFLGVMAHMFADDPAERDFIHAHPIPGVSPNTYQAALLMAQQHAPVVTADMVTTTGPEFTFKLNPRYADKYMVWAQFMRHNKVVTVPYCVDLGRRACTRAN